ncbi:MAG: hypothetical protein ACT4N2_04520 [Hyphomicrobium sp.]
MLRHLIVSVGTAILAVSFALPAAAEPLPTDLLFKLRQLDLVTKGSEMKYHFERKVSNEQLLGKNFADELKLEITKASDKGQRDIALHVFTGAAARDVQNWPDLSTNPLFLWYLDRSVAQLASLAGAEKMYLKGRMRSTFDQLGKVESIKAEFAGKPVAAYRIEFAPLKGDPSASKMEGYDHSFLTFVVSDEVPGYLLDIAATYESPRRGTPRVEERLMLVSAGERK